MVKRGKTKATPRRVKAGRPSVALVAGVTVAVALTIGGFGLASADNGLGAIEDFGLIKYSSAVAPVGQLSNTSALENNHTAPVSFDVSAAATQAEANRAAQIAEQERAAREAETACREQALAAEEAWLARSDRPNDLESVDWSVSREEFISTWTSRIDAFLKGTQLEGQGETFATAAWENGVDPRFSPAISMTESGCGAICFLPHNAWGWGSSSWGSWEEAIADHVAGLAKGYGYCLTTSGAATYCPPNTAYWYSTVQSQIKLI